MTQFVPEKQHLREALLFLFHLKKNASDAHRLLVDAYGSHALSERSCRYWLTRFNAGQFDLNNLPCGHQPKRFEDHQLQALLDEDPTHTQNQLAAALNVTQQAVSKRLSDMGKIQKEGKWVPHDLSEKNKEQRLTTCNILIDRNKKKSFLHRIITGDEKWIYFSNPKRKRSWVDPGQVTKSIAKRNIHMKKALLCIWWDQNGVLYYELLKAGETVNANRYEQQLMRLQQEITVKRPEWADRHGKVILLHDNARPHVAKSVAEAIRQLKWEVLPHPPYSPDIAPSDYHLFRSMAHDLSEQSFKDYDEVQKWLEQWIGTKPQKFFNDGIRKLPKLWEDVLRNGGNYS